jgi:HK97 family phage prohead protease
MNTRFTTRGLETTATEPIDFSDRPSGMEVRRLEVANIEVRRVATGYVVSGIGAPFASKSLKLRDARTGTSYTEELLPGCFARSLASGRDILGLADHSLEKILCRSGKRTLKLSEVPAGLAFAMSLPDTQLARDCAENCRCGNYSGASVGFNNPVVDWDRSGDVPHRRVSDLDLLELSLVSMPAYPQTSANVGTIDADDDDSELSDDEAGDPRSLALFHRAVGLGVSPVIARRAIWGPPDCEAPYKPETATDRILRFAANELKMSRPDARRLVGAE